MYLYEKKKISIRKSKIKFLNKKITNVIEGMS